MSASSACILVIRSGGGVNRRLPLRLSISCITGPTETDAEAEGVGEDTDWIAFE